MRRKRLFSSRYVILTLVFCVALAIFAARLFNIQITQREKYNGSYPIGSTFREITVKANRGEIFDRNGKKLVENSSSYDLYLDAYGFSDDAVQAGRDLIDVLEMIDENGLSSSRKDTFFPFEGKYPNLSYTKEATEEGSDEQYYLKKLLGYIHKEESTSAEELVKYFTDRFSLDAKKDGAAAFTNEEIDALLRLRMNMVLKQFSELNPYLLVSGTSENFTVYVKERSLRCVTFLCENVRVYKYPGYASHILGRTGPIFEEDWEYYNSLGYAINATVGLVGCEAAFEEYLRGSDGIKVIVEDKDGNVIDSYYKKEPVAGKDVWLTIDIDLQIAAEDGLRDNVNYIRETYLNETCDSGAIIATDPYTGEILAIGSYPTYDLSTYSEDYASLLANSANPLTNRALDGTYAPGSVFKIGMSAIGLTEGTITSDTIIECEGRYKYYSGYQPRCWIHPGNHGLITVKEAITVSCNCFYYDLGRQLGIDVMNAYSKIFGLGEKTGVELGEKTGSVAGPDYRDETGGVPWEPGDTIAAAIGQSDNAFTPIQLSAMISTVVTGGTRYSTHLLKYVKEFGKQEPLITKEPTVANSFDLKDEDLSTILNSMREVVLASDFVKTQMDKVSVEVGGKTGTAQVSNGIENGLFAAVAPYDDPEIVVICVIEHASGGARASMAAADVLKTYFENK